MKLNSRFRLAGLATLTLVVGALSPSHIFAANAQAVATQRTVQVERVAPGDVNIGPAFTAAIYENLVKELNKTKQFKQVFRSGDRNANGVSDLLILTTTVESFTEGSETKRATTTVAGATKVKVRTELCTRQGQVVLDRELNGNVRFFGDNLRATHNLAHHVADAINKSTLP